ncbi:MAG TPA: formate--tetrahydrofolate ligase [Oligoflexia bacterium]|nr:formate--tetrahydrofolate ligase [Oligoflexia bacterium]HMR24743.1 formate--tetrahydrofolate ligase [Oligoflexia bacterium]
MKQSPTPSDLQIAQDCQMHPIDKIAEKLGVHSDLLEHYGKYKAKLPLELINEEKIKHSNLILVTAITPTPAGEGKTTLSIGLNEGLNKIGCQSTVVLREPSLGPVFGIKGGAAGGGYSQVVPMEDINLHFTGDFAAIEKANNLLSALIDNNLQSKKRSVNLDPRQIYWKRVMDMNDRALREITIGLGGSSNGMPRQEGFNITPASEIMAILCLAKDRNDLKKKLGNIFVGFTFAGKPIFARDLNAHGAMAILLKDAILPNLVQSLEGNPAILHGGPFANIAQGTNSILATKMGMSLSKYVVTEAGFGADLGAEKFLNIKCPYAGITPKGIVIVATIRALRHHGGAKKEKLNTPNLSLVQQGFCNLKKHIENIQQFGITPVVAINHFMTDSPEEIQYVIDQCAQFKIKAVLSKGWELGGAGTQELAQAVVDMCQSNNTFQVLYDWQLPIEEKIKTISQKIYGASSVHYEKKAQSDLKKIKTLGFDKLPVCMAKTQKSFSDDESLIGQPTDFSITVREFEFAAGAGFVIPILGKMMRMPGLPDIPAAEHMDIDATGKISGLS